MTRRTARLVGLLLALGLALPGILAAQGRVGIGVELGYTRASFSGTSSRGVTLHEGAVAGAFFLAPITPWLALRPGLQIASKGGATGAIRATDSTSVRVDLELVYLDLPVLLRARLPGPGGIRLVLTGGVVPGLRIGCNVEVSDSTGLALRNACDQEGLGTFRSLDIEALGGVGLGIPIESSELTLEARVSQGLRSISDAGDLKNRALTFVISVPF